MMRLWGVASALMVPVGANGGGPSHITWPLSLRWMATFWILFPDELQMRNALPLPGLPWTIGSFTAALFDILRKTSLSTGDGPVKSIIETARPTGPGPVPELKIRTL